MVQAVFLHPRRAEVLSLIALAASGREPLPEALERFAAADAGLRRWLSRIATPLRTGIALGVVLKRARVINAGEADLLARQGANVSRCLERLAHRATTGSSGVMLVRWYPVWLAAAAVLPGLVMVRGFDLLSGGAYTDLIRSLGITLSGLSEAAVGSWWYALALGLAIPAAIAITMVIIGEFRVLRHLLHLWCPEVHRCGLVITLLRHAAVSEPPRTIWWWRSLFGWLRIGAVRRKRPVWDADWRAWLFLAFFRLTGNDRRLLRELPGLPERLHAIGLLASGNAWDLSHDLAEERLDRAIQAAKPLLIAHLTVISLIGIAIISLSPLVKIIEMLSSIS